MQNYATWKFQLNLILWKCIVGIEENRKLIKNILQWWSFPRIAARKLEKIHKISNFKITVKNTYLIWSSLLKKNFRCKWFAQSPFLWRYLEKKSSQFYQILFETLKNPHIIFTIFQILNQISQHSVQKHETNRKHSKHFLSIFLNWQFRTEHVSTNHNISVNLNFQCFRKAEGKFSRNIRKIIFQCWIIFSLSTWRDNVLGGKTCNIFSGSFSDILKSVWEYINSF